VIDRLQIPINQSENFN